MRGSIMKKRQLTQWVSSLTYATGKPMIAAQPSRIGSPMNSASPSRNEITAMLRAWSDGEQHASGDLIGAGYEQLRRQARRQPRRERRDHTLDAAALINEAYLKLGEQRSVRVQDLGQLFAQGD